MRSVWKHVMQVCEYYNKTRLKKRVNCQVRDELSKIISNKGKILVIDITYSQWATCKVDRKVVEWMKKYA